MIPPSKHSEQSKSIHSDQLKLPGQTLQTKDVDAFLAYVFRDISRRPKRLKLKKTAAVVRYMKAIAIESELSAESELVERAAEILWLTLLDTAEIEIANKEEVIQFLEEHALTYLASFEVKRMVELVRQVEVPKRHKDFFRPATLMGKGRAVSRAPAQLSDDLTERIYAAYYALRRTGVPRARSRVAAALNELGHRTHAKDMTDSRWNSAEVNERVRQFEAGIRRRHRVSGGAQGKEQLSVLRNGIVDVWIDGFYFKSKLESGRLE